MLAAAAHQIARAQAFAARVRQGFTILRTPRRYFLARRRCRSCVGWGCRVGSAAAFLEAFGIPGTLRNALLVMVVGSLTTLLPVTPGGVGTQQALIVVVLGGAASDGQLLSFSVGMQAAVTIANALIGGIALVLMLRTLSLRSAIGHARHTQRADSDVAAASPRGTPSRRRWPDGARWRRTGRPSSPSARSALRPTAIDRARREPLDQLAQHLGARRAARRPTACGSRAARRGGADAPARRSRAPSRPRARAPRARRGRSSPTARPSPRGRRLVAAKGAPQPSSVRSAVNAMPVKRPPA